MPNTSPAARPSTVRPTLNRSASTPRRRWHALAVAGAATALAIAASVGADPYPPFWSGGSGAAVHFAPVAWPATGDWTSYTHAGVPTADARNSDPSNGGTSPQGYVNVSSGCTDKTLPSTYYAYRDGVLFFRWRVQQAPNNYATGPSPGSFSSSNPWGSALWTVLIDVNGDGYRDFALQLDGSSGSPSASIDRLVSIYSTTRSQSVDYVGDANIHLLRHNPTAFVDQASGRILNFQGTLSPTTSWPNGAAETLWDYGTTRATLLDTGCGEYFIDYQLPIGMLDASAVGGPVVTPSTTMALFFATSNSLTNPLQKDVVLADPFVADGTRPVPFGDSITPEGGTVQQPIVDAISTSGCGPATLTATIADTLTAARTTSVASAAFFAYVDANGNGLADDAGSAWSQVAAGSTTNAPVGRWTATWHSASLARGQYLVGVKATDEQGHVTYSYLTPSQVNDLPGATAQHFANPTPPGPVTSVYVNTCGVAPFTISAAADKTTLSVGETATFTVTVANHSGAPLAVDAITNFLPAGFAFVTTTGGTLGTPATAPTGGDTGTLGWTFSPGATVADGQSATLVFTAIATAVGASSNTATAQTSAGTLSSGSLLMTVAAPSLGLTIAPDRYTAAPGDTVKFTVVATNGSAAPATGAVVALQVPEGLDPATTTATAGTVSWNAATRTLSLTDFGPLPGSFGSAITLEHTATVTTPFTGANPLVATASLDSDQTLVQYSSASVAVTLPGAPSFTIQLDAGTATVAPGGSASMTITYANVGDHPATGTVVTFAVPAGFIASNIGSGGTLAGGTITWPLGTVSQYTSGTLAFTLTAASPFTGLNPTSMSASLDSNETAPVGDSYSLGVTLTSDLCQTFNYKQLATPEDIGWDGTTSRVARAESLQPGDAGYVLMAGVGTTYVEAVGFYQSPANASDTVFTGNLTSTLYLDRNPGIAIWARGQVYDYDPATGVRVLLGSGEGSYGGNATGAFTFPVALSGTLEAGHRLLWVYSVRTANNTRDVLLQFGGTVRNLVSDPSGTTTTSAPASGSFCTTRPATPTLDTQASALVVVPGGSFGYTIEFGNAGQADMQNASVVHTLPAGVAFVGATLNDSPVTPAGVSGDQYTFTVNSSNTSTPGLVSAAQHGKLAIDVAVSDPFTGTPPTLTATTTLASDQTSAISDTRAVTLLVQGSPAIGLLKSADTSIVEPGATITYTITVVNSGSGPATSVVVTDVLPANASFAYVPGSTTLGPIPVEPDPYSPATTTLTVDVGTLAAGSTAVVTFQMRMGPGGAPEGTTSISNTASVAYAESGTPVSSGSLTVGVRSTPALSLTNVAAPAGPVAPGDEITYTMVLTSVGSGAAASPRVVANIPASTSYVDGSLTVDGSPATEQADGDPAMVDVAAGEVTFAVASMAVGASHTVTFRVRVETPLPAGSTVIQNSALASASNAPSQAAETFVGANAAPVLTVTTSAPSAMAFPLTTLSSDVSGATTLTMASAANLAVGQVVAIGGAYVAVTEIDGVQVTVSAPVSAPTGTPVLPTFEYVVEYENVGNAAAGNVQVTAALPPGATFVSASDGGSLVGDTVTWHVGTVNAGDGGVVRVRVAPSAPGTYTVAPSLTSDDLDDPVTSPPASTSVGAVLLTKRTLTPTGAVVDGVMTATYEITATNQSPTQTASDVSLVDALPPGLTFERTVGLVGGTPATSPSPGDDRPSWTGFAIPGGGQVVVTFVVRVANVGPGTVNNDVAGTSGNATVIPFDGLSTTAEDVTFAEPLGTTAVLTTPPTLLDTASSFTVTVTDIDLDTDPLVVETITVTVTNQRTGEIEAITLTETGPATGVFTKDVPTAKSPARGADNDGTLNIANGDTVRVAHVDLLTSVPGAVMVTAETAIASEGGELPPSLALVKSADKTALAPGETVTYTIAVINSGAGPATSVVVTDVLPASAWFTYVAGSATLDGTPVAPDPVSGATLTVPVGTVAAGATATVALQMRLGAEGSPVGTTTVANTASATHAESAWPLPSNPLDVTVEPAPPTTVLRYFAEGVTQPMATRVILFNSGTGTETVALRFLRSHGPEVEHIVELGAFGRATVEAGELPGLQSTTFGVEIESSEAVAAEQTVTWDERRYGAHSERAAAPATKWYFAEGATHGTFDLYYLVVNPNTTTAAVTFTHMQTAPRPPVRHTIFVAPRSRATVWVDGIDGLEWTEISTVAVADRPVVIERAMYCTGNEWWSAGHRAVGTNMPKASWDIAEGSTQGTFQTFLLLGNPSTEGPIEVEVEYLGEWGLLLNRTYEVAPASRRTVWVNVDEPSLGEQALSFRLRSLDATPFMVERAMWWSAAPGEPWAEAHTSNDVGDTGTRWVVAEAEAGGADNASTYLLVSNKRATAGALTVTLHFEDGTTDEGTFVIGGDSRLTLNLNHEFPVALGKRFSAIVTSTGEDPAPIVVEKSLYWDIGGVWWVSGVSAPATRLP